MQKIKKNHLIIKVAVASLLTIFMGGIGETDASRLPQDKLLAQTNVKENNTYEEFRSFLMDAVSNPNYWVSYQMEMTDHPTMMVEQWLKGEKFRLDTQLQGTTARLYRRGEQVTNCLAQGNTWTCFRLPSLNQLTGPGIQGLETLEEIKNNPQAYRNHITAAGMRVIAGETTTCFKVNQLETRDPWLSCYSNHHGIPLYMEGQYEEGTWKMTATDFQTSVSDRAFSLPAQPQSLPGMPNGFPIPNR